MAAKITVRRDGVTIDMCSLVTNPDGTKTGIVYINDSPDESVRFTMIDNTNRNGDTGRKGG